MDPKRSRRTLARYLLFQTPGFVGAAFVLWAAVQLWDLAPWLAVVLFLLWLAKDLALYPFLRVAYEPGPPGGADALVGATAYVTRELAPVGTVRLGAEHYRAELQGRPGPAPAGTPVRVTAHRGLTLLVEPLDS